MKIENVDCEIKEGEGVSPFVGLFRSRFAKLSKILRGPSFNPSPIRSAGEKVEVAGIVSSPPRKTKGGHMVFDLEDPTGSTSVWSFDGNGRGCSQAPEVLPDEVVGVVGRRWDGGIAAERIVWPDVYRKPSTGEGKVAVVADLHVGSVDFCEGAWRRLASWLHGNPVDLLIVAGDIVDGVGIFPNQLRRLAITDIYRQYEYAFDEMLKLIPEGIDVLIVPGNHDMARPLEPQPPISSCSPLKAIVRGTFHMGTNPCTVEFDGVRILVYHGKSLDDLAKRGFDYNRPAEMAARLLRSRHLAPIWGGETPLAPTPEDKLVIEQVPDIFVVAHSHVSQVMNYKGVIVICPGTFQGPTDYTERMGIKPTPGTAVLINLKTMEVKKLCFA
jgi:DNA polymerase II small subunit